MLQRYLPSIRSIVSIAANAVVYVFTPAAQNWEKSGVEGTLFVCGQEPLVLAGGRAVARGCVFVLNRKGLDNAVVDLGKVTECEVAAELLIFKMEDDADGEDGSADDDDENNNGGGGKYPKVLGLWIHADKDDTQQVNAAIIQESWRRIRDSLPSTTAAMPAASVGPAMQATAGRRLSISDLFGRNGLGSGGGGSGT